MIPTSAEIYSSQRDQVSARIRSWPSERERDVASAGRDPPRGQTAVTSFLPSPAYPAYLRDSPSPRQHLHQHLHQHRPRRVRSTEHLTTRHVRLSSPKLAPFPPWTSSTPFTAHTTQRDTLLLDAIESPRSLTRSPSVNGRFPRTSASPSLLDHPFAWRPPSEAFADTGGASGRTHTPTTPRPESRALDTIIEAAYQDTSMAETSVFGLDHSRLSSFSSLSAPNPGSPDGSWARRSPPYAVSRSTSRASSRRIDASPSASTPTFRPKQLLLIGSPRRHSSQLAPSPSSLLTFGTSHAPQSPSWGARALRLEPALSPRSSRSRLEQSSQRDATNEGTTKSQHPAAQRSDATACGTFISAADPKSWDAALTFQRLDHIHDKKNHDPHPALASGGFQGVSSEISLIPSATSDHPDETLKCMHPPSTSSHRPIAVISPTEPVSAVNGRIGSEVGGERGLRAVSLSPRRSSGSGETRSSETIEFVPWQVATTDTASTRRSEEIFRPLSQALTMSRSGAGSSRDTIGSVHLRRLNRDDATPALSPLQTPLKAESHFRWSTIDADRRTALDDVVVREASGCVELEIAASAPVQERAKSRGEDWIAGPPGAVGRLLLELQGSTLAAAQISNGNGPGFAVAGSAHSRNEPRGVVHHRSTTVAGPLILPRQSSIRRRHLSVQLDQPHRSTLGEQVLPLPALALPPDSPNTKAALTKRSRLGNFHHTRWGRYTLQAVLLFYQAGFFTFEAARLWHSLSPAIPLVAAGMFLVLDLLMVQMRTFQAMRTRLFVWLACGAVPTLGYCAAVCAVDIALLASNDQETEVGIHFRPGSSGGTLADVLQDVPMTAVLFVVGALAALIVLAGLVVVGVVARRRRREQHEPPVSAE